MIASIEEFLKINYPDVSIVSAIKIEPAIEDNENSGLKFYDVTFKYKRKTFIKLFHTRLHETIEEQFKEALKRSNIEIPPL